MPQEQQPQFVALGLPSSDWQVFFACVFVQCAWVIGFRHLFVNVIKTKYKDIQKLSSWTISTLTGPLMSAISLWAIYTTVNTYGIGALVWDVDAFKALAHSSPYISRFLCLYFMAHCCVDMCLGLKFYPKELDPLSVYFHHTVYAYTMLYAMQHSLEFVFALFGLAELANIFIAIGNIHHPWRFDWTFGLIWLAVRITHHGCVAQILTRALYSEYPFALFIAWLGFCLHVWWFWGWAGKKLGFRRERKEKAEGENAYVSDSEAGHMTDTASEVSPTGIAAAVKGKLLMDEHTALLRNEKTHGSIATATGARDDASDIEPGSPERTAGAPENTNYMQGGGMRAR
eukprot:GDKI01000756.1.p1 GENE.GDKI01000756.1~~GDKI01000756.1.p1  ORF type:complete len:343 (-),score=89.19 GDKI01000756.1:36-1064(-)